MFALRLTGPMKAFNRLLSVVLSLALGLSSFGCGTLISRTALDLNSEGGGPSWPSVDSGLAEECAEVSAPGDRRHCYLQSIWDHERGVDGSPGTRPRAGMAISGGGFRSASFSMGVLIALNQLELFPSDFDYISSVSGGGYTTAWLYAQLLRSPATGATALLEPSGPFQEHIAERASVIPNRLIVPAAALNIALSMPLNLVVNGLWGLHANTTLVRRIYEYRLGRTFLTAPCDRHQTDPSFAELRALLASLKLPIPIFNATASFDYDFRMVGASLRNTVYEFSPYGFGSEGMGWYWATETEVPLTLKRAMSVSGAAADSNISDSNVSRLVGSAFSFDLGYFMPNPAEEARRHIPKIIPLAYMADSGYKKHALGERIYLSDGGHSENLGAFALVRRFPQRIVIVDGEHDPEMQFGSYLHLKQRLGAEFGLTLYVADIEQSHDQQCPKEGSCHRSWNTPLMIGSITAPLGLTPGEVERIEVLYIKLSLPPGLDATAPGADTVFSYAQQKGKGAFPQQSTADQSFSRAQYLAYRELGTQLVLQNRKTVEHFFE